MNSLTKKFVFRISAILISLNTFIWSFFTFSTLSITLTPWNEIVLAVILVILSYLLAKSQKDKLITTALILTILSTTVFAIHTYNYFAPVVHFNSLNTEKVKLIGPHLIIGFDQFEDLPPLIKKGAIGGIYLARKNVEKLSLKELTQKINELQTLQKSFGRPPLLIMADQEGGIVNHLSPPLKAFSSLAENLKQAFEYGRNQGQELASIGLNINLAPLLDINEQQYENDFYTQISKRALSKDPQIIFQAAEEYCQGLKVNQIYCTLKHFPGLGRVSQDTHLFPAHLTISKEELNNHELIPFKNTVDKFPSLLMISHTIVDALDPQNVASNSEIIITKLIRQEWQYKGIIITDDVSMGAFQMSSKGLEEGVHESLKNGVDLILISYNGHLFYPIMEYLANQNFTPEELETLQQSQQRLDQLFLR